MRNVLARRKAKRAELLGTAGRFVEGISPLVGKFTAWVYGSVARGDFHSASDVDVLVVAETLPSHPVDRIDLLAAHAPPGVEPKALARAEFEALRARGDAHLARILSEAVLLRDDLGLGEGHGPRP